MAPLRYLRPACITVSAIWTALFRVKSRSINAAIMTFMEKPLLREYMADRMGVSLSDDRRLGMELHTYFMQSIAAAARGASV